MNEISIVGWTHNPWDFQANIFKNLRDFRDQISITNSLLILKGPENAEALSVFENEIQYGLSKSDSDLNSYSIPIIIIEYYPIDPLTCLKLFQKYSIVAILQELQKNLLTHTLNEIQISRRLEFQAKDHERLLREEEVRQERHYKELSQNLSEKQKQIQDIQLRILQGLQQEKLLHDVLMIVISSEGLGEIEVRLQESLQFLLGRIFLKIVLHEGINHDNLVQESSISFELHEKDKSLGQLIITPVDGQILNRAETSLLENISEALALHIPRFLAFEANRELEIEWRSTFDSISDPLILVTEDYRIIESNQAARLRAEDGFHTKLHCYELLFQRNSPCTHCRWGSKSTLVHTPVNENEIWELSSHQLPQKNSKQKIYVHLYRNKYDQIQLEGKISSYAQAAEVGIFKASLAHELNNPIGGILTLAQLQKMDIDKNSPYFDSILQIEKEALRCRDLILDLLQKARKSN